MGGYYAEKLSGRRLQRCYEIAPPRVRQYLEAEIRHAMSRMGQEDVVLELGCGYGRVARRIAESVGPVAGIDNAPASIELARELAGEGERCVYEVMNALDMRYPDDAFDAVLCLQNGICAFGVDQTALVREALRVTRPGGLLLLSSYADAFWSQRLAWFEAQAEEGLLGPVDHAASRDGFIVCGDGFRAGRMTPDGFRGLCAMVGVVPEIHEVDGSFVVCDIRKPRPAPDSLSGSMDREDLFPGRGEGWAG